MLAINTLLVVSFANISSHSGGYLFILLIVSFAVKNLFTLIRSNLFIFVLISFRRWIKKKGYNLCQRVLYLHFPLEVL